MGEKYHRLAHPGLKRGESVSETTPLSTREIQFITEYVKTGNIREAVSHVFPEKTPESARTMGRRILKQPNVKAEMRRIMDELRMESIATAEEVMTYFTGVMRGEIKDQFGLDASLAERTKAAQEIAKRTIDIENRTNGKADTVISVNLNWSE